MMPSMSAEPLCSITDQTPGKISLQKPEFPEKYGVSIKTQSVSSQTKLYAPLSPHNQMFQLPSMKSQSRNPTFAIVITDSASSRISSPPQLKCQVDPSCMYHHHPTIKCSSRHPRSHKVEIQHTHTLPHKEISPLQSRKSPIRKSSLTNVIIDLASCWISSPPQIKILECPKLNSKFTMSPSNLSICHH